MILKILQCIKKSLDNYLILIHEIFSLGTLCLLSFYLSLAMFQKLKVRMLTDYITIIFIAKESGVSHQTVYNIGKKISFSLSDLCIVILNILFIKKMMK